MAGLNAENHPPRELRPIDLHSIVAGLNAKFGSFPASNRADLHSIVAGLNARHIEEMAYCPATFTFHCGWIECRHSGMMNQRDRTYLHSIVAGLNALKFSRTHALCSLFTFHCGWIECSILEKYCYCKELRGLFCRWTQSE